MRTSTTAWAAALAVMSMRGPFTTAEAAPASPWDRERPRYFYPKHMKRGYNHTAPAIESSSSVAHDLESSSIDSSSSVPPVTDESSSHPKQHPNSDETVSSTHSRRTRSSTKSSPDYDEASLIESLISAGRLPETENTVVTTTLTLATNGQQTATYTLTYTETSSHAPVGHPAASKSSPPVPLLTSVSVPIGTAPDTTRKHKTTTDEPTIPTGPTKSKHTVQTRSAKSVLNSILGGGSSQAEPTYDAHNTTTYPLLPTAYSSSSSLVPSSSSSMPLSSSSVLPSSSSAAPSSDGAGIFGVPSLSSSDRLLDPTATLDSLTRHLPTKKPLGTGVQYGSSSYGYSSSSSYDYSSSSSSIPVSLQSSSSLVASSGGLVSGLLPTGHKHTKTKHGHADQHSSQGSLLPDIPATDSILGGHSTGGFLPLHEPSPTAGKHTRPASAESSSATETGNIIVGLSTIISELPSVPLPTDTDKSPHLKPTKTGHLSDLGITGIPTGVSLPGQSILPTGGLGGHKRPHKGGDGKSSDDSGLLPLTNSLSGTVGDLTSYLVPSASGLVGSLTDSAGSVKSKLTHGIHGPLSPAVSEATGLTGTLTNGVDSIKSKVTDGITGPLSPAVSQSSGLGATLTDGVESIKSKATHHVTGVVGTVTNVVGSVGSTATNEVTGVAGTVSNVVGSVGSKATTDLTGVAGTVTNVAGTIGSKTTDGQTDVPTNVGSTVESVADTATDQLTHATGKLPVTVPTGQYTITGGGVTLTVPIPTSVSTSIPITTPTGKTQPGGITIATGITLPTGTKGSITIPAGASTIQSSYKGTQKSDDSSSPTPGTPSPSDTNSTAPDAGSTLASSIPLTKGTTIGGSESASSAYPSSKEPSPVAPKPSSSTASETTSAREHTEAPATIRPTGTDTYTSMTFPTSWDFAPTSTWATKTTTGGEISTDLEGSGPSTGLPTYMPMLVQPPGGMPTPPANATLIQLGFNYGLNYPFVVGEPDSASQIFAYLPHGIAHGLGISRHEVVMNALMPWDTSGELNYITTLAQAYIPSQLVATLEMSLHMPLSQIYSNPDSPVQTLMTMINPTIPIIPGANVDGSSSSAWFNPEATTAPSSQDGAPIGGDSSSSKKVRGSTVGIGVGAVCGAAVYAAAMVYVARRYRRKRQGHQRASSVHTSGQMSQRSGGMAGFFMSGANGRGSGTGSGGRGSRGSRTSAGSSNGRSVREQGISAPVMAENSLGWN